ncbi:MAG: T9SS type A sorting domain-containing protein [Cytophagaceae bacterium]|nr:T9SS type A sorting domain-containing protein [Cytophagaceae bacterium]
MKRLFTIALAFLTLCCGEFALADSTDYGKVLYRVNAGGAQAASIDTSSVDWMTDDYITPCPYVDTTAMGNKVYITYDSVIHSPSVPASTPYKIFKTERGLGSWDIPQLEYNFPVTAGQKVEVRLYFAEMYFDSVSKRVFDILIEGGLKLNDYDIFADAGHDVGVMKSFIVTSDGNLDIDLRRVKQHPKVDGIEIIEVNTFQVAGVFNRVNETSLSAYPNPFKDQVSVDMKNVKSSEAAVFDAFGRNIQSITSESGGGNLNIDLSDQPVGLYYLQIKTEDNTVETVRLIKQ